jgi:hypothetical protein
MPPMPQSTLIQSFFFGEGADTDACTVEDEAGGDEIACDVGGELESGGT